MSYKISSKLVYFAALALSASAYANLVVSVPGPTNNWYGPTAATASNAGIPVNGPYWDQKSADGDKCNIGYWLEDAAWATGIGTKCGNDTFAATDGGPGKPLAFLGGANQSTATGWYFTATGNNVLKLRLEVAGDRNANTFGWTINGVDNANTFSGPDSAITTKIVTVNPGDTISFFLCPKGNCANVLRSQTPITGPGADNNKGGKFALFSESPVNPGPNSKIEQYWIGVEDSTGATGFENRGDYNDFVISATVVPEPGFYGALSLGLGGLFMLVRRRRQAAE